MATPYEFVVRQVRAHLPGARVAPLIDSDEPRRDRTTRLYQSGDNGEFGEDYSTIELRYPGGYPFYYPLQLTLPGQRPLSVCIAPGADYIQRFTRPDAEIRDYLAYYAYWRIEAWVNPAATDFWILMLGLKEGASHYLILPTRTLKELLSRAHDPEKFSLLRSKSGFCFAAQPLSTANRLAVLKNPSLLDTDENRDLNMDSYLNNWHQLAAP